MAIGVAVGTRDRRHRSSSMPSGVTTLLVSELLLMTALLTLSVLPETGATESHWSCTPLVERQIAPAPVWWLQWNCTGDTPKGPVGPMVFNIVNASLADGSVRLVPAVATGTADHLQPLSDMAKSVPGTVLAGVNGGYFWRLDSKSFIDDVCFFKSRADAERPASAEHPNDGVGDGLVVLNGTLLSSNCDCPGYARPATLLINGTQTEIVVQHRADPAPAGTRDAIAAGPNLVSQAADGRSAVDIPLDDWNVNIWEHSSNTAVGLLRAAPTAPVSAVLLVVADGYDGCPHSDPSCGINAHRMAYFMLDALGSAAAMEMDQGGSSTMVVSGAGVVSNPGRGERNIFSGLFLVSSP